MIRICFFIVTFMIYIVADTSHDIRFKVTNLDCLNCAKLIKRHILSRSEVSSINIDLNSKTVVVYGKQPFLFDNITTPILDLGYFVQPIREELSTIIVKAHGIVCSFCVIGIRQQFNSLLAVQSADFSMETGELLVILNSDQTLPDDTIHLIYNDAGYDVRSISRHKP